jgi:hypothetical protein
MGKGEPDLRDVKLEDLESFARIEALYWQAVRKGIIKHSESNPLNWLGAAVRAKTVNGDTVRIFVGLVRSQKWEFITGEQEERARSALARYRQDDPTRFRVEQMQTTARIRNPQTEKLRFATSYTEGARETWCGEAATAKEGLYGRSKSQQMEARLELRSCVTKVCSDLLHRHEAATV